MRRDLRGYDMLRLEEALKELGYKGGSYHTGFPSAFDEWTRKDGFHIKLTESLGRVTLHIRRDPKYHVGRTRFKGEDLENEVKKILKTYKAQRNNLI